jgi:hypothetical protein
MRSASRTCINRRSVGRAGSGESPGTLISVPW